MWVLGKEAWVRKGVVTHHMVLEHVGVQEAVSELGVGSSLHESSDQCSLCSKLN